MGFAIPLPVISGAEPCTGSYIDLIFPSLSLAPNDADGNKPKEPVNIAASSDRISPNKLSVTITSNCFGFLIRNPKQFDVIVTDNLFGDILSDEAAMLTGSLGLLPSASLGAKDKDGNMRSMYEPVHGSAPDITGKGIANPIATILSFSMALKYSLNLDKESKALDNAVQKVLDDGLRTKDIISKGKKEVSTSEMGDAIIACLQK